MPGATSDSGGGALVPVSSETKQSPVYPLRHSVGPPVSPRVSVCWARGSSLRISILQQQSHSGGEGDPGGEVLEVKLNGGDGEISDAQWRRIAYGSVSPFAMLQRAGGTRSRPCRG